jgi:hypothetical protein
VTSAASAAVPSSTVSRPCTLCPAHGRFIVLGVFDWIFECWPLL